MSIPVASDAAQNSVSAAADDVFEGINLPGMENNTPAPQAQNSNSAPFIDPAGGAVEQDYNIQAFSEAPEADFVGARMVQDDPNMLGEQPPVSAPEPTQNSQSTQAPTPAVGTPEHQISLLSTMVQQLMDQNKQLMEGRFTTTNTPPDQAPPKSEAELLQEQVEALVKQEFPEDDGTVGKFAKLIMGQVAATRSADRQAYEAQVQKQNQTAQEAQISKEADEVANSVISQGYTFKNPESQKKFTHLVRDLSLVLTSLNNGTTPKQWANDIQNIFNEGVYARASFLGNRAKTTALAHTQAPRQLTPGGPQTNSIPSPTTPNMNAPISNYEIRRAGYATNADAIFDDYKKVYDMRRRG